MAKRKVKCPWCVCPYFLLRPPNVGVGGLVLSTSPMRGWKLRGRSNALALLLMASVAPPGRGNLDFMEFPRAWLRLRNPPIVLLPVPLLGPGKMGV